MLLINLTSCELSNKLLFFLLGLRNFTSLFWPVFQLFWKFKLKKHPFWIFFKIFNLSCFSLFKCFPNHCDLTPPTLACERINTWLNVFSTWTCLFSWSTAPECRITKRPKQPDKSVCQSAGSHYMLLSKDRRLTSSQPSMLGKIHTLISSGCITFCLPFFVFLISVSIISISFIHQICFSPNCCC